MEYEAGMTAMYGGKPAKIIHILNDNAEVEIPMEWGVMRGKVRVSKLSPYNGELIQLNAEKLTDKCPHDPLIINAIGMSWDRAEEIRKDVIDTLNYYLCKICAMEYITHNYSGIERTYAGYVMGALSEQQEVKRITSFFDSIGNTKKISGDEDHD